LLGTLTKIDKSYDNLFLLYLMHVNDECLRCVKIVPEIVLLRGCKCWVC
jgi:hypothetical protein